MAEKKKVFQEAMELQMAQKEEWRRKPTAEV
jgi:hypothetical protein